LVVNTEENETESNHRISVHNDDRADTMRPRIARMMPVRASGDRRGLNAG
jgi:hypothetical protein